jgi:hypothetical protein
VHSCSEYTRARLATVVNKWKAIWKINAVGKIIIHVWRFAHHCLPSGVQLCRRQIPADGTCVFCGRTKGIEHALLFYQFACEVCREIKQQVPRTMLLKVKKKRTMLLQKVVRSTEPIIGSPGYGSYGDFLAYLGRT